MKQEKNKERKQKLFLDIVTIIIACINFLILQSAARSNLIVQPLKILYFFISIGILLAVIGIIYCLCGRIWIASVICSIICTVYSIVNQYVIEFHGSPLTIPEFANTKTAINVLNSYSLINVKAMIFSAIIILLDLANLILIVYQKKFEEKDYEAGSKKSRWVVRTFYGIGSLIFLCGMVCIPNVREPLYQCWVYKDTISIYGYPLYFMTSGMNYNINEPKGYSKELMKSIPVEEYTIKKSNDRQMPDIILILNETFYDLSLISDIETDKRYMGNFYDIDNTIYGHAVVPNIGGGTNSSEYELLTSNSNYLLQGITPFQVLDMSNTASIISNLKDIGYYTIGMHPAPAGNYARNKGYKALGFDEIHFEDDFEKKEYYGERKFVTDECAYSYMIQWYEEAIKKENRPIFSYLLTIQNHGDWLLNSSEFDTVHVKKYDGKENKDKINEYLSCISLSCSSFEKMVEHFKESNRPTVICMVGDHSPSFAEGIARNSDDNSILLRETPFIIWANYPIREKRDVLISMNQLGPLLLECADVDMIPYYQYIYELEKTVPVITSYGEYLDLENSKFSLDEDSEYKNIVNEYLALEYNNLLENDFQYWYKIRLKNNEK